MKRLFTCLVLLLPAMAFSQSNEQGTIQIGLGWGLTIGGATIEATDKDGNTVKGDGTGAKANYGIRAQYGLTDDISAGIFIRPEAAVYVTTFDAGGSSFGSTDVTYTGTGFGLEGKYYVVNNDGFNFYPGVSIGFTSGSGETDFSTDKTSLSGLNYAVGVGLNWYFAADVFGMSFDLAYQGNNLTGTDDSDTEWSVSNSGLYWGLGFTAHFGGN